MSAAPRLGRPPWYVAGIDAHATYVIVAIASKTGEPVQKPREWRTGAPRTTEALRSTGGGRGDESGLGLAAHDLLTGHGFLLAHAKTEDKRLPAIAEARRQAGRAGSGGDRGPFPRPKATKSEPASNHRLSPVRRHAPREKQYVHAPSHGSREATPSAMCALRSAAPPAGRCRGRGRRRGRVG